MAKKTGKEMKEKKQEEKISENETESSTVKKEHERREKQTKMVFFFIFGVLLVFLIVFIMVGASKKFDYNGISFQKGKQGSIIFYTAKIPIASDSSKYMTADFRNNPKSLENITVNTNDGIKFLNGRMAYVSYGNLKICEDNGLAAANLGIFLSNAGISVKGALDDPAYENNTNLPYVNCETNPDNTVILIKNGNETKIEQTRVNCYEIISEGCDILRATEKFQLSILEEYMNQISA